MPRKLTRDQREMVDLLLGMLARTRFGKLDSEDPLLDPYAFEQSGSPTTIELSIEAGLVRQVMIGDDEANIEITEAGLDRVLDRKRPAAAGRR